MCVKSQVTVGIRRSHPGKSTTRPMCLILARMHISEYL